MGIHNEPITLVASPLYPNSIAWSKENLVAVASGHLITILNPASPVRPRGLITLHQNNPFPIGVIKRQDLLTPCAMPISLQRNAFNLSRDGRPCARSISWSPPGFAPNSGCLLAVCTTEGRVKVYRSPFCEFRSEWVEVVDISEMLYRYLKKINFLELKDPSATFYQGQGDTDCIRECGSINGLDDSSSKFPEQRKRETSSRRRQENKYVKFFVEELSNGEDVNYLSRSSDDDYDNHAPRKKSKRTTRMSAAIKPCSNSNQGSVAEKLATGQPDRTENNTPKLINAQQYTLRSMLLSSIVVAWSPTLQSSAGDHCCILAIGAKSGNISLWRISEPQCYTIEHGRVAVVPALIGLLKCHNSWITAMSWGISATRSSQSPLVFATGSCDGSVKIWLTDMEELFRCTDADNAPLSLLREVTSVTIAPVSTISLVVPFPSIEKVVIAIGRGSGSLEACVFYISSNDLQNMGVYDIHNQVVTGLAWAFDGRCLYSCSQDNSVRSWVLRGDSLCETSFPLKFPGLESSTDLSSVSDLCFGLALSPGELVVAVVRSLDSGLLNPMYQARTQKAAVEFYWSCEQSQEVHSDNHLEEDIGTCCPLSGTGSVFWESTILWCLKHYDSGDMPLVVWDVLMALLSFWKTDPTFVETILVKWMSSWFLDYQSSVSVADILFHVQSMLSKMSTRKLHLLNIICRRLILCENKPGIHHVEVHKLEGEEKKLDLWNKLLSNSERELQERLVSFTFKTVLRRSSCSTAVPAINRSWNPLGVAQMQKWVATNHALVHDQLKQLGSKVGELESRIHLICEYEEEESCSYCSAPVPFESAGAARCKGIKHQNGSAETHELQRCAVSMRIASITSPMWFCVCCKRQVAHLLPSSFFTMPESPLDVYDESESFSLQDRSKPWCPFCGILLQRFLPEFLLSASPV